MYITSHSLRGPPIELQDYLRCSGKIFMRSFPNLRVLHIDGIGWCTTHISSRLIRMLLPFLATLTRLELHFCAFSSWEVVFDVVRACRELIELVFDPSIIGEYDSDSQVKLRRLYLRCRHMRICEKLTPFSVHSSPSTPVAYSAFGFQLRLNSHRY
ncbi:hypothetical protein BD414DRAFT_479502 [Trametes punicea]|nr:hypothetical protein BD414DRAFT_479502 [Trametes punicea]